MSEGLSKEAADLLRKWVAWYDTDDGDRTIDETRAYLSSLEKPAEESVPDPAKWVSVEKVREVLDDPHYFASRANEVRRAIEALLPEPRSADDALAELQTFLAGLSPDETISPSTRKWMMERVKEARGIR